MTVTPYVNKVHCCGMLQCAHAHISDWSRLCYYPCWGILHVCARRFLTLSVCLPFSSSRTTNRSSFSASSRVFKSTLMNIVGNFLNFGCRLFGKESFHNPNEYSTKLVPKRLAKKQKHKYSKKLNSSVINGPSSLTSNLAKNTRAHRKKAKPKKAPKKVTTAQSRRSDRIKNLKKSNASASVDSSAFCSKSNLQIVTCALNNKDNSKPKQLDAVHPRRSSRIENLSYKKKLSVPTSNENDLLNSISSREDKSETLRSSKDMKARRIRSYNSLENSSSVSGHNSVNSSSKHNLIMGDRYDRSRRQKDRQLSPRQAWSSRKRSRSPVNYNDRYATRRNGYKNYGNRSSFCVF